MSQTLIHTVWRPQAPAPGTWTILRISVLLVVSAQWPTAAGGYAAQSVAHSLPHLRPSSSPLFQHAPHHHNIRHQHYEAHGESIAGYLAPLPRASANANTHHHHQQHQHPHQPLHQPPQGHLKPSSHQHQQHFHQPRHKPINATHKFAPTTSTPTPVTTAAATTTAVAATATPISSATTIRTAARATGTPLKKAATSVPLTTKAASAPQNYYQSPAGSADYAQRQQQQQPSPHKRQQQQPSLRNNGHHNHKLQPASHLLTAKPVIAHWLREPGHGGGGSSRSAVAHAHNQSEPLAAAAASGAGSEASPFKATHDRHEQLGVAHNALSALKKKPLIDQYADALAALEAAVSAGDIDDIDDDYDYSDEPADSSYDAADDDNVDDELRVRAAAANNVDNHQQHKWAQQHQQQQQQQKQQQQQQHQQQEWRTRVTRDHHRLEPPPQHNHLAADAATRSDDEDYADDEPSRGSDEQFGDNTPGKLTQQKFEELGTREAVQQTRERYMQEQERLRQKTPTELAIEHRNRMKVAAKCSRPLPRVFHVSNDTSKTYLPHCTILHRCGEDTGCCPSMGQVCTAKSYEDVPLYFFVSQVNTKRFQTEILWLRNDTECHCVDRANLTDSPEFITRGKRSGHALRRHSSPPRTTTDYSEEDADADADDQANAVCRCPRYFDAVEEDATGHLVHQRRTRRSRGGAPAVNCRCECLNAATACQRFKNGEEGFAMDDRRCISEGLCSAPNCSYGPYSHRIGRCPRPSKKHKRHDSGFG